MRRKDWIVVGINIVVATGLIILLGLDKIGWEQLLVGLGLLGLPSVASLRGAP